VPQGNESPLRQLRWLHPPFARGAYLRRGPVRRKPPLPKGGGPAQPVEGFLPPTPPKPQNECPRSAESII